MAAGRGKRLEWSPRALDAYLATLRHIASENPRAAELVSERVERALAQIVVHYKVMRRAIRIQIWYRARQHMKLGL